MKKKYQAYDIDRTNSMYENTVMITDKYLHK